MILVKSFPEHPTMRLTDLQLPLFITWVGVCAAKDSRHQQGCTEGTFG
jgi:hypothetical protein